jgi:hypothetical protein
MVPDRAEEEPSDPVGVGSQGRKEPRGTRALRVPASADATATSATAPTRLRDEDAGCTRPAAPSCSSCPAFPSCIQNRTTDRYDLLNAAGRLLRHGREVADHRGHRLRQRPACRRKDATLVASDETFSEQSDGDRYLSSAPNGGADRSIRTASPRSPVDVTALGSIRRTRPPRALIPRSGERDANDGGCWREGGGRQTGPFRLPGRPRRGGRI